MFLKSSFLQVTGSRCWNPRGSPPPTISPLTFSQPGWFPHKNINWQCIEAACSIHHYCVSEKNWFDFTSILRVILAVEMFTTVATLVCRSRKGNLLILGSMHACS